MAIEEVEKKLYSKEEEKGEEIELFPESFLPRDEKIQVKEEWREEGLKKEKKPFFSLKARNRLLVGALIILFLSVAATVAFIIYGRTSFNSNNVTIEIFAPRSFKSGDKIIYKVIYKNNSRKSLEDAKLIFNFPENSEVIKKAGDLEVEKGRVEINIGSINSGEEQNVDFSARVYGIVDELKEAKVFLSYRPEKLSAFFESKTSFTGAITSVPISLNFIFQKNIISGQETNVILSYSSQSNALFKNFAIVAEYPSGFTPVFSEPVPSFGDNIWNIGDLEPMAEGKILISGILEGQPAESKFFTADIGPFIAETKTVSTYFSVRDSAEISSAPFVLKQMVNDQPEYTAEMGEKLNFTINYKNNTSEVLRSVVINTVLSGKALNFSDINFEKGSFDGVTNTIIWNAGTNPELEFLGPGAEGKVSFSVSVKDPIVIQNFSDKNFIITSTANISTSFVPEKLKGISLAVGDKMEFKINSRAVLTAKVYYYDLSSIPNSGPMPPKVGQTTTYNVIWQIMNYTNDIENVEVSAILPPHVKWVNAIKPNDANITYDPSTGKLLWRIDRVFFGTGILRPISQVAFQISITPSLADVGRKVALISESELRAKDIFTGKILSSFSTMKDTELPDDPSVDDEKTKIVY